MRQDLDAEMIAAHTAHDLKALVGLYTQAADQSNDMDAACFYLTHAYIFALDAGVSEAAALHARLKRHGREQ